MRRPGRSIKYAGGHLFFIRRGTLGKISAGSRWVAAFPCHSVAYYVNLVRSAGLAGPWRAVDLRRNVRRRGDLKENRTWVKHTNPAAFIHAASERFDLGGVLGRSRGRQWRGARRQSETV